MKTTTTTTNEKQQLKEKQALVKELWKIIGFGFLGKKKEIVNQFIEEFPNYARIKTLKKIIKTINLKNASTHFEIMFLFLDILEEKDYNERQARRIQN